MSGKTNVIEADAKSSLTDLDWYSKIRALYAGKQTEVLPYVTTPCGP